tara:strand:+ start:289 stop:672 length:384 start_codon:yes stop_codon:yes gene_type:complete
MTQDELQKIIGKRLGTDLIETKDKYCSFDCYDGSYVVELKCRKTHYDTQLIEYKKLLANKNTADESGKEFLYAVSTPEGEYIFNISKLLADDYDFGWEDRSMPSNTEFAGTYHKKKRVGYINVVDAY